jgi:hypothetical protein
VLWPEAQYGAALQWAATLLLQKACGHERPVVDLPDDLLLPGVALHVVLSARVGLGCGLALGGGVAVTFPGERCPPEPVTEDPVLYQLGAVEPENMWGSHPPEQSTGQLNTYLNNGSPI